MPLWIPAPQIPFGTLGKRRLLRGWKTTPAMCVSANLGSTSARIKSNEVKLIPIFLYLKFPTFPQFYRPRYMAAGTLHRLLPRSAR